MIPAVRAVLREPFGRRARLELVWCLVGLVAGSAGLAVIGAALYPGTAASALRGVPLLAVLVVALVGTGAADKIGDWHRALAARLLGVRVEAPPPLLVGGGSVRRFAVRLRHGGSWRAGLYLLVKLPLSVVDEYPVLWWLGAVNLTYPFWWGLFRNHDPGVRLRPVPALTSFGVLRVTTLPGALVVFACGAGMVLVAPWVTRAVAAADRWLLAALVGAGRVDERVRQLEASRSRIADDAAVTLRRIERDLHDGAQAQLATLAMKLGQAKEKLEDDPAVDFDRAGALALVDAAHRHAKEALTDLRNIARGIHPPALDLGLDAALATLVARSPVPAELRVVAEERPARAIETIAYFSVAELLANVARHSGADHATVDVAGAGGQLRIAVTDDGVGGARIGTGTGLPGLAARIHAVEGHLDVSSPPGGPTVIVVELPLHA